MKWRFALALSSYFISAVLLAVWLLVQQAIPPALLDLSQGSMYTDRYGQVLALRLSDENQYLLPSDFSDLTNAFVHATIVMEDRHFFGHTGIDTAATARAGLQNLVSGEVVSGASTITQQLAKKMLKNKERSITNKLQEIWLAFQLEHLYSKQEIFSMWAERAPFGGNIIGVTAAAEFYFHKPPSLLSTSEAAFLAAIPNNPSFYSPRDHLDRTLERRELILNKMYVNNYLSFDEWQRAKTEMPVAFLTPREMISPHLIMLLQQHYPDKTGVIRTSINAKLQQVTETAISRQLGFLRGHNAGNAAAIVIENKSGAVRAYVGSSNFFDDSTQGKNDLLQSYRQTGSTLKPYLYALAFLDLGWTAETITLDEPASFDTAQGTSFRPKNIDLLYKGPLSVRQALAESRNIPAVKTLQQVGEDRFFKFLRTAGVNFLQDTTDVGLSGALGAAEMRIIDLAFLYVMMAREGSVVMPCYLEPCFTVRNGQQIIDQNITREITAILADNTARTNAFGEESPLQFDFDVAAKTGTTRNFRDNYTVGYTPEYTVLVWTGNADGSEMQEVTGITGAGPIFHEIIRETARISGKAPFVKPNRIRTEATGEIPKLRFISPLPNTKYALDSERPIELQKIRFEVTQTAEFLVDGEKIGTGTEIFWLPAKGLHTLTAITDNEQITTEFQVQ